MFPKFSKWKVEAVPKTLNCYKWLKPSFTTSKPYGDAIIANLLLTRFINSSSDAYGTPSSAHPPVDNVLPSSSSKCGMPSITLLGTQGDWQQLLQKTERLTVFGTEPAAYGEGLHAIL
jgi:hypothetical protein